MKKLLPILILILFLPAWAGAVAIAAGWYSMPGDYLDFDVEEDINTDVAGTAGHEIVYSGEITGQVVIDEDYINAERLIIN